jgi:hypothetical protein
MLISGNREGLSESLQLRFRRLDERQSMFVFYLQHDAPAAPARRLQPPLLQLPLLQRAALLLLRLATAGAA